jgi:hypothetical protein
LANLRYLRNPAVNFGRQRGEKLRLGFTLLDHPRDWFDGPAQGRPALRREL